MMTQIEQSADELFPELGDLIIEGASTFRIYNFFEERGVDNENANSILGYLIRKGKLGGVYHPSGIYLSIGLTPYWKQVIRQKLQEPTNKELTFPLQK